MTNVKESQPKCQFRELTIANLTMKNKLYFALKSHPKLHYFCQSTQMIFLFLRQYRCSRTIQTSSNKKTTGSFILSRNSCLKCLQIRTSDHELRWLNFKSNHERVKAVSRVNFLRILVMLSFRLLEFLFSLTVVLA